MVSAAAEARGAERAVLMGYVPAASRDGIAALLALDDGLARIVRTTREPIVGQMRLTWWYEALTALGTAPPPAEPVLAAIAAQVLPRGVTGAALAAMTDGWEVLLGPDPVDDAALRAHAAQRGGALFAAMACVLGAPGFAALPEAGAGWALADLARHWSDAGQAEAARAMAVERLTVALRTRWPIALRPLGMLAHLARDDLRHPHESPGSPRRLARMLMHRIWGR